MRPSSPLMWLDLGLPGSRQPIWLIILNIYMPFSSTPTKTSPSYSPKTFGDSGFHQNFVHENNLEESNKELVQDLQFDLKEFRTRMSEEFI